jgi:hypothetical protein
MSTKYNKVTDEAGNVIGWTHQAKDESGYYSQAGLRPKKNFFGFNHATETAAAESLRKNAAALKASTETI